MTRATMQNSGCGMMITDQDYRKDGTKRLPKNHGCILSVQATYKAGQLW